MESVHLSITPSVDINNILGFERDYPNAQIYKLEQNYRSTKNIY